MKIQKTTAPSPIGEITLYTLTNSAGASVTLSSLGAGINSVVVPDASGKMDNVVLVPKKAVIAYGGATYVRQKLEDGSIIYQSFVAGGSDDKNYWVAQGLTEGTEICIE